MSEVATQSAAAELEVRWSATGASSPATATACSAALRTPRTPCSRRSSAPGEHIDRFEGRSTLRSWLYRIATNVCFDMLGASQRRARPMDLTEATQPRRRPLAAGLPDYVWIEPMPDSRRARRPAATRPRSPCARESMRLAFVAALQHLPAAPARRPHPARGAALAGRRGRPAAGDLGGLGEQRAAAGPRDARQRRRRPTSDTSRDGRRPSATCSTATSTRSSATTSTS